MTCGPSGRVCYSQNQLVLIMETPRYFHEYKKTYNIIAKHIVLCYLKILDGNCQFLKCWKRHVPRTPEGPSYNSSKS